MKKITVGVIGFGTIGTGVVKTLENNKELFQDRIGVPVDLKWVADIDIVRDRGIAVSAERLTTDGFKIVDDPEVDIVIELVGGCGIAKEFIVRALKNGKSVVTANKALLAEHGKELFEKEEKSDGTIAFEAAVAGGIPIIKVVRESFVANRIESIHGIINGTANYIFTKMAREKISFAQALKQAQELGYAEADPTLDVDGIDSAHKLVILGSLASSTIFSMEDCYIEGIRKISEIDIDYAEKFGYVIKLLAIYKNYNGQVQLRIHPTLIPDSHLLGSVMDSYNGIFVKGDVVGSTMFYGRGAGELPTASAVLADVVDIARAMVNDTLAQRKDFTRPRQTVKVTDISDIESRYYFRFTVIDQPGVLAEIAGILGRCKISISDVLQKNAVWAMSCR
ncbi:MAG: homoserine dehydrogenase [bacterium]|nr:homoserine dehydrogenase [bacterium]